MKLPNTDHIVTYVNVIEAGSFSRAAEQMQLSKSVVSKHITALEEFLQVQLLKRTTRKLILTDSGNAFYQQVKNIPDQIATAQLCLQDYIEKPYGHLKIIAPLHFDLSLKMQVIPQFLSDYKDVKLHLDFVSNVNNHVDDEFDIIILWKLSNENFADYPLIPKKLFSMPIGLYASPEYLKQNGCPKTPEDLQAHNCFSSAGERWPFSQDGHSVHYHHVTGNLATTSENIIKDAVKRDLGIAYCFPFVMQDEIEAGSVVSILDDYTQLHIDVYAFYHPNAYIPLKITQFIKNMRDFYQQMQDEILRRGKKSI